jgi:dihydrolipoamide dehydrogenase
MMKSKQTRVDGLTSGIEALFKQNKVEYLKGWGKISGPNEVTVNLAEGGVKKISATNIIIATGSEVTPVPNIAVSSSE